MATAAEQVRLTWIAAGLFTVTLAAISLRSIKAGRELAARPVAASGVESFATFLTPLSDSAVFARTDSGAMVLARDPFVPSGVAHEQVSQKTALIPARPKPGAGANWVVSSILFEGSKKSAIVNNTWVTIGDSLGGGSHLTAVEADYVVVTDAKGVRHTVRIQGGESWQ